MMAEILVAAGFGVTVGTIIHVASEAFEWRRAKPTDFSPTLSRDPSRQQYNQLLVRLVVLGLALGGTYFGLRFLIPLPPQDGVFVAAVAVGYSIAVGVSILIRPRGGATPVPTRS